MTSYIFSTNQNSAPNCEIKKGDIIPFLYVKEQDEVDDNIKNSPKELAKYAYLACINGWSESASNDLWYEEYEAIFGDYDEEKLCEEIGESLEELEVWYMETFEKYQNERGKSGNALLGATIDTIIKSDYSIGQQVEAVDYYLKNIEGIDDYKENMARNELMAKYMMENNHIGDLIKDYNVGINFITENLQYGTQKDKNTKTCILSDFQVLEFDHTLDKDGQSDDDGISDLTELTTNIKWANITEPMQKYYYDMLGNGKTTKSFDEVIDDLCKKQGKYTDSGGNIVWGHLKYEGGKVYYKTRDYSSNPMLNDTDFDGLNDNKDNKKTSGLFKGNTGQVGNIDFTNDFRWFFTDNTKYNDEVAVMSFIMSNLADGERLSTDQINGNISSYMKDIGFGTPKVKSQFIAGDNGKISGKMYLGKKTIQIGANRKSARRYKDVYGIFFGEFDTVDNYKFLLTNFDKEEVKEYYENIVDDAVRYIEENKPKTNNDYCYWVTGYSIAGGIAAEVAARLKEDGEVYCYTFGATNAGERVGANSEIKNIINEDDLIPKIYNRDEGFVKSGALYNDSIFDNLTREYRKYIGSKKEYEAIYTRANTLKGQISNARNNLSNNYRLIIENAEAKILCKYQYINEDFILSIDKPLLSSLNASINKIKQGHEKKSYYVLAKALNGFDLNKEDVGWTEVEEEPKSEKVINEKDNEIGFNSILGVLTHLAKYYINTINTHEATSYINRANSLANGENGAKKYYKLSNTSGSNGLNEYEYPDLKKLKEIRDDNYMVSNSKIFGDAGNRNFNLRPYNTGDSCSDFAITAIRMLSDGYRGEPIDSRDKKAKDKDKDDYGLYLHNTFSLIMQGVEEEGEEKDRPGAVGSLSFERAMNRLGWSKIYVTEDMTVNDLEIGDILVSKKHTEFYTGTNYNTTYKNNSADNINTRKQSGIEEISMLSSNNKVIENGKLLGTFGWGGVQNEFPLESSDEKLCYFYKYPDENYFRHCECGHDPNKDGHGSSGCNFKNSNHEYRIIWRRD